MNLQAIASKVKKEHAKVTAALNDSLEHARQAGDYLSEVQRKIPYKEFVAWVVDSVGISEASANNYCRIFRQWAKLPKDLNYTEALKARKTRKAKPDVPQQPLTEWQKTIQERMGKFKIKGALDDVQAFLESFGVPCKEQQRQAA